MDIHIDRLHRSPSHFRPVLRNSLDFITMKDSIRDMGILTPLLIRPEGNDYEIIKGVTRYEACLDLRIQTVPCHVVEMTDEEVLRAQVVTHASVIEPTTAEYALQLRKVLKQDIELKLNDLSTYFRWHPDRVMRVLGLNSLSAKAKKDLTSGELCVIIGVELARLPAARQDTLLELNDTMPTQDFLELLWAEVRDSRSKKGGGPGEKGLRFRPIKEVKHEYLIPTVAASVLCSLDATTKLEAFRAGVGWTIQADPASVEHDKHLKELRAAKDAALLQQRIDTSLTGVPNE